MNIFIIYILIGLATMILDVTIALITKEKPPTLRMIVLGILMWPLLLVAIIAIIYAAIKYGTKKK